MKKSYFNWGGRITVPLIFLFLFIAIPFASAWITSNNIGIEKIISKTLKGYEQVSATSASSSANKVQTVSCTNGNKVVGGGCEINNGDTSLAIAGSYPVNNTSWSCDAREAFVVSASWNLTAYAICLT